MRKPLRDLNFARFLFHNSAIKPDCTKSYIFHLKRNECAAQIVL